MVYTGLAATTRQTSLALAFCWFLTVGIGIGIGICICIGIGISIGIGKELSRYFEIFLFFLVPDAYQAFFPRGEFSSPSK